MPSVRRGYGIKRLVGEMLVCPTDVRRQERFDAMKARMKKRLEGRKEESN